MNLFLFRQQCHGINLKGIPSFPTHYLPLPCQWLITPWPASKTAILKNRVILGAINSWLWEWPRDRNDQDLNGYCFTTCRLLSSYRETSTPKPWIAIPNEAECKLANIFASWRIFLQVCANEDNLFDQISNYFEGDLRGNNFVGILVEK